jgi:hypothetical protein
MPSHPDRPHKPRPESYPLRVFRVKEGCTWTVLCLSERIGGCFVHWLRGRSFYCDPRGCPPAKHNSDRQWKGYAAAHLWDAPAALWLPIVLEVTESLELDLRGLYARGQLWEVSRPEQSDRRKTPVAGRLIGTRTPRETPAAFDVKDVLRHLYHTDVIDLTAKNPLPSRVIVEPFKAPPPVAELDQAEPGQAEPLTGTTLREKLRAGGFHVNGKTAQK